MAEFHHADTPQAEYRRAESPLAGIDLVLTDLDGVIYRGPEALPHSVESINALGEGIRVAYITNNASRTDVAVAEHLTRLGLQVAPTDVVTSPQAAVTVLKGVIPPGSVVLVVGGDGLTEEVTRAGFQVTRSALDGPAAVIQGFAPEVGWVHLAEAAFALNGDGSTGDLPWIATNTDWTIPQARGTAPGNGTLVSAVHTAVGRLPIVAGKPEVAIFQEALTRPGGSRRAVFVTAVLVTGVVATARLVTMNGQSDQPSDEHDEISGDALLTRLRVIEGQALETRAPAFAQLYDELQATLEGGDPSPGASPDRV